MFPYPYDALSGAESLCAMALAGARVACLFVSGLRGLARLGGLRRPAAVSVDPSDTPELRAELVRDEGLRAKAYTDTTGNLSIGVGRNLNAIGLRPDEIALLLSNDIAEAIAGLDAGAAWWRELDAVRGRVLVNMAFNLGWPGLAEFHTFLAAMQRGDWVAAGAAMQESRWWRQVGARAARLQAMVLTGSADAAPIPAGAAELAIDGAAPTPAAASAGTGGTWQNAPVGAA